MSQPTHIGYRRLLAHCTDTRRWLAWLLRLLPDRKDDGTLVHVGPFRGPRLRDGPTVRRRVGGPPAICDGKAPDDGLAGGELPMDLEPRDDFNRAVAVVARAVPKKAVKHRAAELSNLVGRDSSPSLAMTTGGVAVWSRSAGASRTLLDDRGPPKMP